MIKLAPIVHSMLGEAKGNVREQTLKQLFFSPFDLFARSHLKNDNANSIFRRRGTRISKTEVNPKFVKVLAMIPNKYWLDSTLEEIFDNQERAARDHETRIEQSFQNTIKLELKYDRRIPSAVVIEWKCSTSGYAQQMGGNATNNQ